MAGKRSRKQRVLQCHTYIIAGLCLISGAGPTLASVLVDLEDLSLEPNSFYNGSDGAGGFTSRGAFFNNTFTDFVAWSGWSYSNMTDAATPGFENQYSAIAGGGADGSGNYAVAFAAAPGHATVTLPTAMYAQSVYVTNTTYAYFSMLDGDAFAKQFGGPTGDDPDYFLLTISGLDPFGTPVGVVDFYLADYRFETNTQDYIIDSWTEVDLSALEGAEVLSFGLESTDVGPYGMNTPSYFAMDNLHLIPEPATLVLAAVGAVAVCRRTLRRQPWR
ncbi:MAG: DUF4465 domain-containing protein [Phycisphaerales bacterium]|nr:MAG: DUF4465 domain-containing protein [Phycisphaerales bacterium]